MLSPLLLRLCLLKTLLGQQKFIFQSIPSISAVHYSLFVSNQTVNDCSYTLRNDDDFLVPHTNLGLVQKTSLFDFPSIWDSIDQSSKDKISYIQLFKKNIQIEL